ncbi:hypothetical protein K8P10_001239 [Leucobacter sp. Psy1]|nr:hypothetical protein K8P10_001239 [Leucobacter sp. Psy1]
MHRHGGRFTGAVGKFRALLHRLSPSTIGSLNYVHVMYEVGLETLDEPAIGVFSSETNALAYIDDHRDVPHMELRWQSVPLHGDDVFAPKAGEIVYLVSDGGPSDGIEATYVSSVGVAAFRSREDALGFAADHRETRYVSDPRVLSMVLDALTDERTKTV